VGDDRQSPEIGAGGAFGALARQLPAIELRENRRQHAAWEREALALPREGDADGAVQRYAARGPIVADANADEVRRRLVADWWEARNPDDAVMIAHRRRDVADLNGRAHEVMRVAGALSGPEISVGDLRVAVGDRVLLRRNHRRLGVVNGDRGLVLEAGDRNWSSSSADGPCASIASTSTRSERSNSDTRWRSQDSVGHTDLSANAPQLEQALKV
jgi:ATP-dependent exoDNAse (exonuclease V) alpha subunit